REAITANHELDPYAIVLVKAGSIHKTSSGKLQRRACRAAFAKGELEVLAEWRSDGTKRHSNVPSAPRAKTPSTAPPIAGKPAAAKLKIDLAGLRRPGVIVVARSTELAADLGDPRYAVSEGDRSRALASGHAVVVSDDLAVLAEVAAKHPATVRIHITAFDDPEAVRSALANNTVASVLPATAGKQQLVATVREQVDAWVAQQTDLATTAIEDWLAAWLADRLDLNPKAIDLDAPVGGYGLDSLTIVEVQTAFSDWLGHEVPATLLRGRSSIRSIARRLTSADVVTRAQRSRVGDDVAVAIVGMGCTTPGATDVGELWDLIANDRDLIGEVSEDRIRASDQRRFGGTIDHVTAFDATFFGMAPRDAATIDPQHRILFETTWRAFEDAGISPAELSGSNAAVFVGISGSDFLRARPELSLADRPAAAAHRLSYFFNLRGPSFAVDSGDASALVALQLAVGSLQRGECDLAIAAGVNLTLTADFPRAYERAKLISSDGKCRPLDAHGDGTALSDGCGVVVLRRLTDAREGANRIHAQVLSVAVGQNGRGHGLTAPNEAAQERVLREAIQAANVAPGDVGYVELNGRGVRAFDMIEALALASVLGADRAPDRKLVVGSLKANLGDTRAAAGMLGVIKTAL
ncbi:MAG: beta-ketoacyl synthase N-terminal-like domain-containing protein, partial [Kofleriaceae bacterium]